MEGCIISPLLFFASIYYIHEVMKVNINLKEVIADLEKASLRMITPQLSSYLNELTMNFINSEPTEQMTKDMYDVLVISNILYNNTDRTMLPLEDGVYDLAVTKYNKVTGGMSPVGATPVVFPQGKAAGPDSYEQHVTGKVTAMHLADTDGFFFKNITGNTFSVRASDFEVQDVQHYDKPSKKGRAVAHEYPELVGTLDKCKFTLINDAVMHGVDPNDSQQKVAIFERDFMMAHRQMGFDFPDMCATLKYDGISVEAQIQGNKIVSARSRGDTGNDEAQDLTHIFGGYVFQRACGYLEINDDIIFGIKFECIITFPMLNKLAADTGMTYVNGRTAIIGLTGRDDARRFRDYMTLVPICTGGLGIDNREVEINFLNKYYSSGVDLRYAMIHGDYMNRLYMVSKFAKEAEAMRPYIPFMYDGVVIEYTNPIAKQTLGRINSVNKWAIAIKFSAMKKRSIITGCEFTVGQDGSITPMAYFNPVEFFGTIHPKTTIHSFKKFNQMDLHIGDVVELEYRHDVIVYLTKPNIAENAIPKGPKIPFPEVCPVCGTSLMVSDTGDTAYCPNMDCDGRRVKRVTNMLKKLNFKDFGEAYVVSLNLRSFSDLFNLDYDKACAVIGEVMTKKFFARVEELKTKPYPDNRVIGALGFSNLSAEKWKLILKDVSLEYIMDAEENELYNALMTIKGIGETAALTVVNERKSFMDDLKTIACMDNIQRSYGDYTAKVIVRFTGCRDSKLVEALNALGTFDASGEKGVTKKTDILVVPYVGFQSSKLSKINTKTCRIVTPEVLWESMPRPAGF